jgi:hypothetical protein
LRFAAAMSLHGCHFTELGIRVLSSSLLSLEDWLAGRPFLSRLVRFGEPAVVLPANGFMVVRRCIVFAPGMLRRPLLLGGWGLVLWLAIRQPVGFGGGSFRGVFPEKLLDIVSAGSCGSYILYYCRRALQVQP